MEELHYLGSLSLRDLNVCNRSQVSNTSFSGRIPGSSPSSEIRLDTTGHGSEVEPTDPNRFVAMLLKNPKAA